VTQPAVLWVLPSGRQPDEAKFSRPEAGVPVAQGRGELRLEERVGRALRATGYPPLRATDVAVREGLVILRGRVPSYYLKQIAQATVLAVPGVQELCNDLDVARPS
jgi:osmotically-inducible protein OsmY